RVGEGVLQELSRTAHKDRAVGQACARFARRVERSSAGWIRKIQKLCFQYVPAQRAYVARTRKQVPRQLPLHREVPCVDGGYSLIAAGIIGDSNLVERRFIGKVSGRGERAWERRIRSRLSSAAMQRGLC